MRHFRLIALGACFALALPCAVRAQPAAPVLKERDGAWAQTYVPRAADPAVRFGRLPNGFRYAVMRNGTPSGVTSLRLRIGAGSLQEAPGQEGLAHFLEHMAFKGSAKVPGDAMIKTLERMGLAFGADTNAFTTFDETVYKLDLPQSSSANLATALMLLREQAGELTLSQAAMDPERGVVLSEERLRDTPGYRAGKARVDFLLEGQRAPTRWTIGDPQVLRTAPVSRIRDFYAAWYRPELATLVVVGDLDPAAMEAQIRTQFGDWADKTPSPAPVDLGEVKPRGPTVRLFSGGGVGPSVQVTWVAPYDDGADTFEHDRNDFIRQLGLSVLDRRLALLAEAADPPFIAADASTGAAIHSAQATGVSVSVSPQGWRKGLVAALVEQRRLDRYGVSQVELDREIAETRGTLAAAAAGAATRRSPQIADAILQAAANDNVYTSPAQDLAEFERAVKGLTAAEVSAAVRQAFSGSGPLAFVTGPEPIVGGEPAVQAAVREALSAAVTPQATQAALVWPYARPGPPANVVSRREVKDLGVTFARLSNGVTVTVKPTAFRKDEVLVSARYGEGRLALPRDRATPAWAASSLLVQGGLQALTYEQVDRLAAGRVAGATFSVGDDSQVLSGTTRPADLPFEMQLLTAYLAHPGLRPDVLTRTKAAADSMLGQIDSTPSGVLGRDFGVLTHSGDRRWQALPTRAELAATTVQGVDAAIGLPLGPGPLDVTIVGDVTVEHALALAGETFGALPPRRPAAPPPPAGTEVRFPAPGRVERLHKGRSDQAVALVAWPTTDLFSDTPQVRALGMAAEILQLRLTDRLRVAEGATYSPGVQSIASEVFPGYGFVFAQVETPPAKIKGFFDETDQIAAELAAKGPSPDELDRARNPRVEQRIKTQETNEYWVSALARAASEPRRLQLIRDLVPGTRKVTAAEVQAATARYLRPDRAWRLVVRAADPSPGSPSLTPIAPSTPPRPPVVTPAAPATAAPSNTGAPATTALAPVPAAATRP